MSRPLAIAILVVLPAVPAGAAPRRGLTVEECVAIALETNASIEQEEARVSEYRARLAEVEATYYPKLTATGFIAPMFTIKYGDIGATESVTKWKSLRDWGPYTSLEAMLTQPIYSFGRVEAGTLAASERMEVERAQLQLTRNTVAREARRWYYMHLYAVSMLPSLDNAANLLAEAQEKADGLYERGTGDVTMVDLSKLRWGALEVAKFQLMARRGGMMALAALKQVMGWPEDRDLTLAADRLPRHLPTADPDLTALLAEASQNRPEWAQVEHGERATLAWANAEFLANMPIVALAGFVRAAWAPSVDDTANYYHNDPYNDFYGGVALALHFDLDPWAANAREDIAMATHDQILALHRFAATGIPLQVRKGYSDLLQSRELVTLSRDGSKATKRWLTFAAAAFASGTGEARDILEGLAAYLQAKNSEYDALRAYFLAQADLDFAIGRALRR